MSELKQFLFEEESELVRLQMLEDNCDAIEDHFIYVHDFSEEELLEMKDKFSKISISIDVMLKKKKEAADDWKSKIEPYKNEAAELLDFLRVKNKEVNGRAYAFHYHDNNMVAYYDKSGKLISSRRMTPKERQGTIFKEVRTGTN